MQRGNKKDQINKLFTRLFRFFEITLPNFGGFGIKFFSYKKPYLNFLFQIRLYSKNWKI